MTSNDPFETALAALFAGDVAALAAALRTDPGLVHTRCTATRPPYDGYFHGATLLHHVAGNPTIRPLPDTVLDAARLLLDAGSEVDAVTLQGPSQPDDIGWTTLGLVATNGAGPERQVPLLDLLLDAGADVDARNGGCLMGALYYGQGHAARHLAAAGARLDMVAAAGVGDMDRLGEFLAISDEALAAAPRLVHYARVPWPAHADASAAARSIRGLALVYAALHGREAAMRALLDAGADPDHRPPFEHGATPLHWAVLGDRPEAVRILAAAGADLQARDREFDATPAGWAAHLGRPGAAAALAELPSTP